LKKLLFFISPKFGAFSGRFCRFCKQIEIEYILMKIVVVVVVVKLEKREDFEKTSAIKEQIIRNIAICVTDTIHKSLYCEAQYLKSD